jgi:hypothetical protein
MSRFAFGLPYFLFGLGSALNTGEHVIWSIKSDTGLPEFVPRCLCNIDHPDMQDPAEVVVHAGRPAGGDRAAARCDVARGTNRTARAREVLRSPE